MENLIVVRADLDEEDQAYVIVVSNEDFLKGGITLYYEPNIMSKEEHSIMSLIINGNMKEAIKEFDVADNQQFVVRYETTTKAGTIITIGFN